MSDPLDKATGNAPPIIGSGCTQRYDPDEMGPDMGADFSDAEALWQHQSCEVAALDSSSVDGGETLGTESPAG